MKAAQVIKHLTEMYEMEPIGVLGLASRYRSEEQFWAENRASIDTRDLQTALAAIGLRSFDEIRQNVIEPFDFEGGETASPNKVVRLQQQGFRYCYDVSIDGFSMIIMTKLPIQGETSIDPMEFVSYDDAE